MENNKSTEISKWVLPKFYIYIYIYIIDLNLTEDDGRNPKINGGRGILRDIVEC